MKIFKNQCSFEKVSDDTVKQKYKNIELMREGKEYRNFADAEYCPKQNSHSDQQMVTVSNFKECECSRFQKNRILSATRNKSKIRIAVWHCTLY